MYLLSECRVLDIEEVWKFYKVGLLAFVLIYCIFVRYLSCWISSIYLYYRFCVLDSWFFFEDICF